MYGYEIHNVQMGTRSNGRLLYKHVHYLAPPRYCRAASFSPPTYQWKKAMSE